MTKIIIASGLGYVSNGTVYFDVEKYSKDYNYGALSNRKLEELLEGTRELGGQDEKKGRLDFALWIKAKPEHLMRWPSPWGWGFPGWHIECSAMSTKYLGTTFDIHGGGMDLIATHHTNEIAQSQACNHCEPVKYWMHTNMLTVNGVRMSKSAGNGFLPMELFTGKHKLLDKAYAPMAVRFFMLQTHYRSTLDFSNQALQASEKGFERLMKAVHTLEKLIPSDTSTSDIKSFQGKCYEAMNDDFNSPVLIAQLFEGVRIINSVHDGKEKITQEDLDLLRNTFNGFIFDVLGLKENPVNASDDELASHLMTLLLDIRKDAKANKNFQMSDMIRDRLAQSKIIIKDTKQGTTWEKEN